eukprot:CAMPEP_0181292714 /NCGR_PEP_ID=MMETSP1101-20121128/2663_1 /TAXON_ID=46948 /ORGANISM="Rhodomonas abbreviata, Strain Caron Lab Isolate" /LENGTH=75 /DNA_ID=CAMNT_0023397221 /DNA_START=159 /DNA_END=387 /DNA_ORIENTATION=-
MWRKSRTAYIDEDETLVGFLGSIGAWEKKPAASKEQKKLALLFQSLAFLSQQLRLPDRAQEVKFSVRLAGEDRGF